MVNLLLRAKIFILLFEIVKILSASVVMYWIELNTDLFL